MPQTGGKSERSIVGNSTDERRHDIDTVVKSSATIASLESK
jgi:hypothetical protein